MKISKIISQIMKVSVVVYRMTDSNPEKERRHTGFLETERGHGEETNENNIKPTSRHGQNKEIQ